MNSHLVDEEKNKSDIDIALSKMNNTSSSFTPINSALVKLNIDDMDNIKKIDDIDIEEIEKKLSHLNNPELYTRENQISRSIEDVIKIPRKIIKDEANILSDEKKRNIIKKKEMEKENEQDNQKRKIEMDLNEQKIKAFNDKLKQRKLLKRRKIICILIKFSGIIIIISSIIICLIIYLDKILKNPNIK